MCEKDAPRDTKILNHGVQTRQRATDPGEHPSVSLLGQLDVVGFEKDVAPAHPALTAGAQLAADVAHDASIFAAREGRGQGHL